MGTGLDLGNGRKKSSNDGNSRKRSIEEAKAYILDSLCRVQYLITKAIVNRWREKTERNEVWMSIIEETKVKLKGLYHQI